MSRFQNLLILNLNPIEELDIIGVDMGFLVISFVSCYLVQSVYLIFFKGKLKNLSIGVNVFDQNRVFTGKGNVRDGR